MVVRADANICIEAYENNVHFYCYLVSLSHTHTSVHTPHTRFARALLPRKGFLVVACSRVVFVLYGCVRLYVNDAGARKTSISPGSS